MERRIRRPEDPKTIHIEFLRKKRDFRTLPILCQHREGGDGKHSPNLGTLVISFIGLLVGHNISSSSECVLASFGESTRREPLKFNRHPNDERRSRFSV
jgi:hypothetical protein